MPRIQRQREQRAGLPLEHVSPGLAVLPDFSGAASFDDEDDLFIEMPLDVERAGGRHLDHVAAPKTLCAVKLDKAAAAAEPRPRCERQILHPPHADAAIDRHAFGVHEPVVGHGSAIELAETGVFAGRWFMPVGLMRGIVHGSDLNAYSVMTVLDTGRTD